MASMASRAAGRLAADSNPSTAARLLPHLLVMLATLAVDKLAIGHLKILDAIALVLGGEGHLAVDTVVLTTDRAERQKMRRKLPACRALSELGLDGLLLLLLAQRLEVEYDESGGEIFD
eukprot:5898277-Prymnesium_polylepis.2